MKNLFFAAALAITTMAPLAHADYSDSGSSSVQVSKDNQGRMVIVTTTVDFNVQWLYDDAAPKSILLKKIKKEKSFEGLDGTTGQLEVIARATKAKTFDTALWKISEEAHDGSAVDEGIYLTWKFGCCDSATSYRAYNIVTGKLILTYDDHTGKPEGAVVLPFVVDVPNAKPELKRFIGIITESATRDFVAGKTADGLKKIATITYATKSGALKRYDLFGTEPSNTSIQVDASIVDSSDTGKNEVRANHLTLWSSDGVSDAKVALHGFAVKVSIFSETESEALLPFSDDRIDLARVTLPSGFRLIPQN